MPRGHRIFICVAVKLIYNISMDIRIKTTDYEITPDVSSHLSEKVASIEKMIGSDSHAARLEVEIARAAGNQRHGDHMWRAEFLLTYPGSPSIRASNNASTVNAAIDDAKNELVTQIRTDRQAHRRLIRKTGAAIKRLMRTESEY